MVAFPVRPKVALGDVAALAETVRPIITPWYAGYIYIIDPDEIDDLGAHPYWAGKARIQPMRTNLLSKETTNDTTTRVVEIQCDYAKDGTFPDVPPGHWIAVAHGGNNHNLELYQYVVTGSLNSTSAFNVTIFTQVDLEARANWSFGEPTDPGVKMWPLV